MTRENAHDNLASFLRHRAARDLAEIRRRQAQIEAKAKATRHLPLITIGDLLDEIAAARHAQLRPKLRVMKGGKT